MISEQPRRRLHVRKSQGRRVDSVLDSAGQRPGPGPWNTGPPPIPGKYWTRLGCGPAGLVMLKATDIARWPRDAAWKHYGL
jgi:hypothetical protein